MPNRVNTFPPRNGKQPATTRYQSGFSNTMWGELNDFPSSAPAQERNGFDKFRQALADGARPPADSPFSQQYRAYKQQGASAALRRNEYRNHVQSYERPSRQQIAQNPQSYAGQPKATREWHQSAGTKAGDARDAFERAADGRKDMAQNYIGYDTKLGAAGHKIQEQNLRKAAENLTKTQAQHTNAFPKR